MAECKACGESIVWLKTTKGKNMPVDADTVSETETMFEPRSGHVSHFSTCPEADKFRKSKQLSKEATR